MASEHGAIRYREAAAPNADAIAELHADSWRQNYRGAYSDTYLDGDVSADRRSVWRDRLGQHQPDWYTVVAEGDGAILGFAHTILREDPQWGALLENLHVRHDRKRAGVGTGLMAQAAHAVLDSSRTGIYLWVLEQNTRAQSFYQERGGTRVERGLSLAPAGDPSRLVGKPAKLRYAWPDPAALIKVR